MVKLPELSLSTKRFACRVTPPAPRSTRRNTALAQTADQDREEF
jgi:hypothetical protein